MEYHFQSIYNHTTIFIGDVANLGSGTEFPIMLRLIIKNLSSTITMLVYLDAHQNSAACQRIFFCV